MFPHSEDIRGTIAKHFQSRTSIQVEDETSEATFNSEVTHRNSKWLPLTSML